MALKDFQTWLRSKVGRAMYLWGAQGHRCTGRTVINRFESTLYNQERAFKLYLTLCSKLGTNDIEAFDCSGLGMAYLQNITGTIKYDTTANGMLALCDKINKSAFKSGDWVFRVDNSGKAYHIGYIVSPSGEVVECEGRSSGVIMSTLEKLTDKGEAYWEVVGRPLIYKAEIESEDIRDIPVEEPIDVDYKIGDHVVFSTCYGSSTDKIGMPPFGKAILAENMKQNHGYITQILTDRNQPYRLKITPTSTDTMCFVNNGDIRGYYIERPAIVVYSFTCNRILYKKEPMMSGDDVLGFQKAMNKRGYSVGKEDGVFGSRCDSAIRLLQTDHPELGTNGKPDGKVGQKTVEFLGGKWK